MEVTAPALPGQEGSGATQTRRRALSAGQGTLSPFWGSPSVPVLARVREAWGIWQTLLPTSSVHSSQFSCRASGWKGLPPGPSLDLSLL